MTSFLKMTPELKFMEEYTVTDLLHEGAWRIPQIFQELYPMATREIMKKQISLEPEDELLWEGSNNGKIMVKEAYDRCRRRSKYNYGKTIWRKFIPPKISMFTWKVMNNRLVIADKLHR